MATVLLAALHISAQETSSKPTTSSKPAASSQKPAPSASSPTLSIRNWKTYCSEEGAYCVSYPPTWDIMGDVFEGRGMVVAPTQNGKEKSMWNEITASVTDLPEEVAGKERPSFDEIISIALHDLPGEHVETLQRTEMELHQRPAELVKVKYVDPETKKPWIEEIVFIDDEEAIYSVALRAVPEDVPKLEDTFRTIVSTWRPSEAPPAVPAPPSRPAPKPATKAPVKPPQPH